MIRRSVCSRLIVVALLLAWSASRTNSQTAEQQSANALLEILEQRIEVKEFQAPMTLKEALGLLAEKLAGQGKELPILVDEEAFKIENPNSEIFDTPIRFPPYPRKMSLVTALQLILKRVPCGNATYLVQPSHILITTAKQATPDKQSVQGLFVKQQLDEILEQISAQSGISIMLDPRVGERAKMRLTAKFRNEISLLAAVRLVADMTDLKVVIVENVLYVTSKANEVDFATGPRVVQE